MDASQFTTAAFNPDDSQHIERVIDYCIHMGCAVSNIRKPWSDNSLGAAATALAYALPSDHPRHPNNGGIWNGLDGCKKLYTAAIRPFGD